MESGQLVPDDLITGVVCDRLSQSDCKDKGWLLDGFPRTSAQAEALQAAGLTADAFILLDVPQQCLVERVTGRRTDPVTGKIYHLTSNPPPADPEVLERLVQRSDDTEEKIVVRYKEYQDHVNSVSELYEDRMIWVDGSLKQTDVTRVLLSALSEVESEADLLDSAAQGTGIASEGSGSSSALNMVCAIDGGKSRIAPFAPLPSQRGAHVRTNSGCTGTGFSHVTHPRAIRPFASAARNSPRV